MTVEYIWRIDSIPSSRLVPPAEWLIEYGTFPNKEAAEKKIEELKNLPRYQKVNLVASKQAGPTGRK